VSSDWATTPAAGEVQVYALAVPAVARQVSELAAVLTADEHAVVARQRRPDDWARAVVGRAGLRHLLGRHLDVDPREVPLVPGTFGKPQLASETAADLRFNVSHSADLVLMALASGREVGVDVEQVRSDAAIPEIVDQFFSPTERAVLRGMSPAHRTAASFACWTLKEAYLKARGGGLDRPLDEFDVVTRWPASGRLADACVVGDIDGWAVQLLDVGGGYAAAVAAAGSGPTLPSVIHHVSLTALISAPMCR
jgi:4'-phosphopantetheinyl transferase